MRVLFLETLQASCDGGLETDMINDHGILALLEQAGQKALSASSEKTGINALMQTCFYWPVDGFCIDMGGLK